MSSVTNRNYDVDRATNERLSRDKTCPVCHVTYGSKKVLKEHYRRVHDVTRQSKLVEVCPLCGFPLSTCVCKKLE